MKLSVLALDYDGTIARNDRLDRSVEAAIGEARHRGIKVMLVTGRNLDDLRRAAEATFSSSTALSRKTGLSSTFRMVGSRCRSGRSFLRLS